MVAGQILSTPGVLSVPAELVQFNYMLQNIVAKVHLYFQLKSVRKETCFKFIQNVS
jgi:hypothetical protein